MDDEGLVLQEPRPELGKEQKVALLFVIICGAGAALLGAFYVWHHMAVPFVISYTGPKLLVGDDAAQASVTKDKATDTDKDGLNDYDEKNIYGTSPYLADTDSDGLNDQLEVTSGTDPLCKTGASCDVGVGDSQAIVPVNASGTFVNNVDAPTIPAPPSGVGGDEAGIMAPGSSLTAGDIERLRQLPVAQIRELLVSSGAGAEEVKALTDEEVQSLFDDLLTSLTPTP
jgi:hypothetical protein